jgi:hypothetical protein
VKAIIITARTIKTKANVAINPYSHHCNHHYYSFLNILLPFEPTLFPKLQVYFADFPYLRYAKTPEAINLEDLMRLLVRNGLKINAFATTHHFSWNNDNAQLMETI